MGVIPARLYLCTSPGEGCQQRRHIRGFRKKFEKQLLFGRCVKALKRVGCRCLWFPGGLDRRCGFHCTAAPIKLFLEPCGVYTAVVVQDVGIPFRDHRGLCVAGVTLNGFNSSRCVNSFRSVSFCSNHFSVVGKSSFLFVDYVLSYKRGGRYDSSTNSAENCGSKNG